MTEEHNENHHDEVFMVPVLGNVGVWPGGVYTFIFVVLAVLTAIEVGITLILPEGGMTIALLIALSLTKAYLVVMFYMHLRTDNPIFRLTMLIPLILVIISIVFLIFAPVGAGLGYS